MNLMLTATCDDTDAFHEAYLAVKPEFADWCDVSRRVFGKIDDNTLVELFFDVDPPKLQAAQPRTHAVHLRTSQPRLITGVTACRCSCA